ncbi:MAG: hypothetical protein E7604_07420 [Ruminococcaceae bacterium]|nr:hypothetical protein [Oscillospiraceae bacterium]
MKQILWNITRASLLTLVAYLALYAVWGAILNEVENETLQLFLVALMTTAAFGLFLLYFSKIRGGRGDDEIMEDYRDGTPFSFAADIMRVVQREKTVLIAIAVIVLLCFALNTFDRLIFEKKTLISFPTFFFAPMCLFSEAIPIPFVGYAVSAILDGAAYLVCLLIYRKKKYQYWMMNRK